MTHQDHFAVFASLFVLSGISGLVYQVVWARKLQIAFGVNLYAIAAVLAAYFLGMALGSWLGGKVSDRSRRPLIIYALLEIGIGVTALVVTPLIDQLDIVLQPFNEMLNSNFYLLQGARFILTLGVLIVPTTLLGATVPFMNRGVMASDSHIGKRMATLYAANTLGAVAGVLVSGFYLIERIGLMHTAQLAAALSVAVGLLAIRVNWRAGPVNVRSAAVPETGSVETRQASRIVLPVMGLSGALGLSLEVLWTRLLIQGIGSTAYVFSIVLALFLAGIAIGSYIVRSRVDHWKDLYSALALTQGLAALFTLAGVPILNRVMPAIVSSVMDALGYSVEQAFFQTWALWAAGALLPATIALGASLPIAARLITSSRHAVGKNMGRLYAINTYGGVVGSLCTGFVLLPMAGVYGSITLISALYLLVAAVLVYQSDAGLMRGRRLAIIPIALSLLVWFFLPPGLVRDRVTNYTTGDILAYEEDYYGSILVTEEGDGDKFKRLLVNGTSYSGTGDYAVRYMRLQGHLPVFMSQKAVKNVLVICLGVGLTAGAITTHPDTALTVVELSRTIVDLSVFFADVNEEVHLNPDVTLVTDDGRNYLVRNPGQRFDVITLEPPPPVLAGMANLYSLDFYELAKSRMTDEGVIVQWIPLHTQSNTDTRMLIATFFKAFPNSSLWWTESGEALILGKMRDTPLVPGHIQNLLSNKKVARSLGDIDIFTPAQLAAHFLVDQNGLERLVSGSAVMTDDLPVIEYRVPVFNDDYTPLLKEMIQLRPDSHSIAKLLGISPSEADAIDEAWLNLKNSWYEK
ncbi:putative membrane-bound spermidine synthase [Thiogranum longum]|uniref:Putative membrane-bound spermidine synthase n=1 Tax=Thiogranum longum TaxID=1537524 RepID=A0A4R1H8Q7_9GAMM|nr:putative membrane-bound spermidine synthase [Thiogranum longum]